MKKVITLIFIFCNYLAAGQQLPIDTTNNLIFISQVVTVENTGKDELFERGRYWFADPFNSGTAILDLKDFLQLEDKAAGELSGKGIADLYLKLLARALVKVKLHCTVNIFTKDGEYRYEITNLYFQAYPTFREPAPPLIPAERLIVEKLYRRNGRVRRGNQIYKMGTMRMLYQIEQSIISSMQIPSTGNAGLVDQ